MRPVVVVVGRDFADARRYILANRDSRPILQGAVIVSCTGSTSHWGLNVAKVIETPGARFGRTYAQVMSHLRISAASKRNTVPLS